MKRWLGRHAAGGRISGPSNVDPDSMPVFLSPPEAWMTQREFDALDQATIDAINGRGTIVHIIPEPMDDLLGGNE